MLNQLDLTGVRHIHLMGIGGAGMSGLALLFHALGYQVSGCDMGESPYCKRLKETGVHICKGHGVHHLNELKVDLLAYSSAIPANNPELEEARRRGIPVVRRADLLSSLFNSKQGIGIAGTHGKTTTTSMISLIFEQAGMNPTVAIGGELCDIGTNAKLGTGELMVAELDESDGSFLSFAPKAAVITNIDWDHVDHYPSFDSVKEAFGSFVDNVDSDGYLVLCGDDVGVQSILPSIKDKRRCITYGLGPENHYRATDVCHHPGGGVSYTLNRGDQSLCEIHLRVSGVHFLLDSLAACALSLQQGVPIETISAVLATFSGAKRRLQFRGSGGQDVVVYDDYGHHPKEVGATLDALGHMYPNRKLILVFQPHRYSRTQALGEQFVSVLGRAHTVVLLPIYAASEQPIEGVTSQALAEQINKNQSGTCYYTSDFEECYNKVMSLLEPGCLLVTEGAGDVYQIGEKVLRSLLQPEVV